MKGTCVPGSHPPATNRPSVAPVAAITEGLMTMATQVPPFTVCFHGVGTPTHEREPGEASYWVDHDRFRALLDWVAEVPRVAVCFDDGNRSDVDVVLPALTERGMVATFFPVVGRLGDPWSI